MKWHKISPQTEQCYVHPFTFRICEKAIFIDFGGETYLTTTEEDPKTYCLNWAKQKIAELSEYFNE